MDSFSSYLFRKAYKKIHKLGDRLAKIEPLIDWEAFNPDSLLYLAEVSFCGCLVSVSAGVSEVWVSLEAFDEVFDVGYLEELVEHEGFEVPFARAYAGDNG